ncbi:2-amino-4-hydroxy-6-hydroxymethyldihydropteridine diphosphokinase [Endozoicomonas sp.]|uniref:2-amino-4-hydroxy-6- hydroxymethyldihydropteridine diphosphokinase n=1 Tax=Endozoicomonas sp. TaxID=1892382 RepID=UPI00383B6EA0
MTVYVLGIGSNENAEYQCRRMISAIDEAFGPIKVSELVVTRAVGINAPDYVNGVVCFESDINIEALKQWCKSIEGQLGRDRSRGLCAADIDLLLVFDWTEGQPTDEIIDQINESWFRPLVVDLLSHHDVWVF